MCIYVGEVYYLWPQYSTGGLALKLLTNEYFSPWASPTFGGQCGYLSSRWPDDEEWRSRALSVASGDMFFITCDFCGQQVWTMSMTWRWILVLRGAFSFVVLPPLRGGGRGAWSPIWLYVALTNHQRRGKDLPFCGIVLVERKNDRGAASQAHQQRQWQIERPNISVRRRWSSRSAQ